MSKARPRRFKSEKDALRFIESALWKHGPVCPFCKRSDSVRELKGKTTRLGLRKCNHCRKPFTVRKGTVFQRGHLPLRKWLIAIDQMQLPNGTSPRHLQRLLGVTMKTALRVSRQLRWAQVQ